METKKGCVTIEEFDDAVAECAAQVAMEHLEKPYGSALYSIIGMTFAAKLREILFKNQEDKNDGLEV